MITTEVSPLNLILSAFNRGINWHHALIKMLCQSTAEVCDLLSALLVSPELAMKPKSLELDGEKYISTWWVSAKEQYTELIPNF